MFLMKNLLNKGFYLLNKGFSRIPRRAGFLRTPRFLNKGFLNKRFFKQGFFCPLFKIIHMYSKIPNKKTRQAVSRPVEFFIKVFFKRNEPGSLFIRVFFKRKLSPGVFFIRVFFCEGPAPDGNHWHPREITDPGVFLLGGFQFFYWCFFKKGRSPGVFLLGCFWRRTRVFLLGILL